MQIQPINSSYNLPKFGAKIHIEKSSVNEVGHAINNCGAREGLNRTLDKLGKYHEKAIISLGVKYLEDADTRVLYAKNNQTDVEMFEEFPSDAGDTLKADIVYRLLSDLVDTKLPCHNMFWESDVYGKEEMPNISKGDTSKSPILHRIFY